jgi:dCMP deaminase
MKGSSLREPCGIEALMDLARHAATASPSPLRKIGAVLVTRDGATQLAGCNGFPKGVRELSERRAGDEPLLWMEHAERNVIYEAARRGDATQGATLASTFFPCLDCARAIVQAGIARLYTHEPVLRHAFWLEHFRHSPTILAEGGVDVRFARKAAAEA